MKFRLIAVGTRMPDWVGDGYESYARRLSGEFSLQLQEIPLPRRGHNANIDQCIKKEDDAILALIGADEYVITLDETGRQFGTRELATRIEKLRESRGRATLLIGGPDGLGPGCRERADESWSLSRLTLPHPLVRLVLVEQLYRAWSVISNHPYHRD